MTEDFNQNIQNKQQAVRSDAYLAKRRFDSDKPFFDDEGMIDPQDDCDGVADLRHELKLMMALFESSKLDDIVHLIANPTKLMGLNFIIGFIRGLGFSLAVLIIVISILVSVSDTFIFNF